MHHRLLALALVTGIHPVLASEDPSLLTNITLDQERIHVTIPAEDDGSYFVLYRGDDLLSISNAVDVGLPPNIDLSSPRDPASRQAYFRVAKIPLSESQDLDGDGISDADELRHPGILDPLESRDADLDFDSDGKTNKEELHGLFGATDPGDATFASITFKTADDFTISASLGIPQTVQDAASQSKPAVIFIHQGGSNRHEWEAVAKQAFREGWVTLAYDIRGHGDSSSSWTNAWYDDPDNAPEDLKAALAYLKNLTEVDPERLAVVGASVGGNLACVASAQYGIKTAVAISHKTSAVFNLAGADSLAFRSIFHLSSQGDQGGQRAQWAAELHQQTAEPSQLEITPGSGHGVAIFNTDPTVPDRILQWLRETL